MIVPFRHVALRSVPIVAVLTILSWSVGEDVPLVAQRGPASAANTDRPQPWMKPVPRAECGKADRVETALQGQTQHRRTDEWRVVPVIQLQPGARRPIPG